MSNLRSLQWHRPLIEILIRLPWYLDRYAHDNAVEYRAMLQILSVHHIQAEECWDLCIQYVYHNLSRSIGWHAKRNIDGSELIAYCVSEFKLSL